MYGKTYKPKELSMANKTRFDENLIAPGLLIEKKMKKLLAKNKLK